MRADDRGGYDAVSDALEILLYTFTQVVSLCSY
jgi:hypothetical protein